MARAMDALVIGAGVSGLTTALSLTQAGLRVRIWTAEPPSRTTSAAAGAMWGPYLVEPVDKVMEWSRRTLAELERLAEDATTGVRMVGGIEASRQRAEPPVWSRLLPKFRRCGTEELPDGFIEGFRYTVPLVDMSVYLGYLAKRFQSTGGEIETRTITSLPQAAAEAPLVVNCTGVRARFVVPDEDVRPIRGQLVVVANPGIDEFFSEDTGQSPDLMHIYPQGSTVVLGGTAEEANWNLQPDPDIAREILARCVEVEPRLEGAEIIDHRVGLRPTRAKVRCEEERLAGSSTRIVHNYGHGGAGVTLSWGCADEVVRMVASTTA